MERTEKEFGRIEDQDKLDIEAGRMLTGTNVEIHGGSSWLMRED